MIGSNNGDFTFGITLRQSKFQSLVYRNTFAVDRNLRIDDAFGVGEFDRPSRRFRKIFVFGIDRNFGSINHRLIDTAITCVYTASLLNRRFYLLFILEKSSFMWYITLMYKYINNMKRRIFS